MNSSTNNNTSFSPYLLSRFHQHLNHLNDMAFTHTKILQEIIEKRSNEPMTSSPHGSISSASSSSSTIDSIQQQQQQQRKRSYPCNDNHEIKNENHLSKRPRKQSKPQQLLKLDNNNPNEPSTSSEDEEEEEEMGEIIEPIEKQNPLPIPPSTILPFPPNNLPFLNYIQDLARANNITSPTAMGQFLENLQRDFFSVAMESRRMQPPTPAPLPPFFSQTVHHHHHPYFAQILYNNSFINNFPSHPSLARFGQPPSDGLKDHPTFPFHFSAPKKRRTKVTDTRLSPRIASKIPSDDLTDDENSSSHHSSDGNPSRSDHQPIEYNGFQISDFLF